MLAARAAGRGDVLFRQRQGARVDLLVLAVLAHGGPLPRGVLGGSPDAYREAGFRWGTATSSSTSSGTTSCSSHGGRAPNWDEHFERETVEERMRTYGTPIEVEPHDALLQEVRRTAGHGPGSTASSWSCCTKATATRRASTTMASGPCGPALGSSRWTPAASSRSPRFGSRCTRKN